MSIQVTEDASKQRAHRSKSDPTDAAKDFDANRCSSIESMDRDASASSELTQAWEFEKVEIQSIRSSKTKTPLSRINSCGQTQNGQVVFSIIEHDTVLLSSLVTRKDVDLDHFDGLGMQPIHYAAKYGNMEVIKILLQHGANVNQCSKSGEFPLDFAVAAGNFEVAQHLVDRGARVKTIVNGMRHPVSSHKSLQRNDLSSHPESTGNPLEDTSN